MDYERGATNMIADGDYEAVICKAMPWENPNGPDKLIVHFSLEDGTLFSQFFTPGFEAFDLVLALAGVDLTKPKGTFDEKKLLNQHVKFTTKITEGTNGTDYCNVVAMEAIEDPTGEAKEPAVVKEEEVEKPPFSDEELKEEEKKEAPSA